MQYDSTRDTAAHIAEVQQNMSILIQALRGRSEIHDASKYTPEEKSQLDAALPSVKKERYGSNEYILAKKGLEQFLHLHHSRNTHHPEHYKNGIAGMDILDIVEMICDWKAANTSEDNVSFNEAIEISIARFEIGDQLAQIIRNTIKCWPS